jgi:hypothetical protein
LIEQTVTDKQLVRMTLNKAGKIRQVSWFMGKQKPGFSKNFDAHGMASKKPGFSNTQ